MAEPLETRGDLMDRVEQLEKALADLTARAVATLPNRYAAGSGVDHLIASVNRARAALEEPRNVD